MSEHQTAAKLFLCTRVPGLGAIRDCGNTRAHTHTHARGALWADMGLAPTCSIPCCHLPRPVRLVDCYRPLCRSTWKHTLDLDKLLLQRRVGCRSPVRCPVVTPRGMTQLTTAPQPRLQLRQVRIELTTLGS